MILCVICDRDCAYSDEVAGITIRERSIALLTCSEHIEIDFKDLDLEW